MSTMQTLSRGLAILDILAEQEQGISVTELARRLEITNSGASRMLKTLAQAGYVRQGFTSRRYYLAEKVVWLSHSYFQHIPIRKKVKPILRALVEESNETSHLAILMHDSALVLEDIASSAMLRVDSEVGRVVPLHCTAIGKCLLAFHQLEVPLMLDHYTEHTITDSSQLEEHMKEIRSHGYALDDEEFTIGVRCLAAPVYDTNGHVVAAIGISGPTARISPDRITYFAEMVKMAARRTSSLLAK